MDYLFTSHAEARIEKRGLSKEEVIEAIKYADKILKKHDKYYAQKHIGRGIIEIVYERTETHIKVISVYWI